MVRPASPNTRYFQRQLQPQEKKILLAAGQGDMSAGFLEVMSAYQHFYNLGLRPDMPLQSVRLVLPSPNKFPLEIGLSDAFNGHS